MFLIVETNLLSILFAKCKQELNIPPQINECELRQSPHIGYISVCSLINYSCQATTHCCVCRQVREGATAGHHEELLPAQAHL